eukprot:4358446-Pyramimonas_sp.AAC.1
MAARVAKNAGWDTIGSGGHLVRTVDASDGGEGGEERRVGHGAVGGAEHAREEEAGGGAQHPHPHHQRRHAGRGRRGDEGEPHRRYVQLAHLRDRRWKGVVTKG